MFGKKQRETDVLVVGAGPVGLFGALCLAERGVRAELVDQDWRPAAKSYALALHPGSLELLDELGLAQPLIERGHRIDRVAFYEGDARVGQVELAAAGGAFPFVVVVPQSALEELLERELKKRKVKVQWNHQAMGLEEQPNGLAVKLAQMEKYSLGYPVAHTEWMVAKEYDVRASFLVGADGYHSLVRRSLGLRYEDLGGAEMFAVFEFPGRMEFQHEVRVLLHGETVNVVWPLSDGRGRFSFQVDTAPVGTPTDNFLELVRARAPWFRPVVDEVSWSTTVLFERRLVERFGRGRVWLAGDAAHITGPVGVQSMNVGLREVHDLVSRIARTLDGGDAPADLLERYGAERMKEWLALLGRDGHFEPPPTAPDWVRRHAARIPACLPASGDALGRLLSGLASTGK